MIVAGHALGAGDVLIFDGGLEHHAFGKLVNDAALDFLPRRLVGRILVTPSAGQGGAALSKFRVGNQDVGRALAKVNADAGA